MVVQAARVGGSLACISGCGVRGAWMPPGSELHVAVPNGSRHLKHPIDGSPIRGSRSGLVVHWSGPSGDLASFAPGALPIRDCLLEVLHCQPADVAFAIVESALATRLIDRADIEWLVSAVPSRRRLLLLAGSGAGSGTESLFRFRLEALGIRMRSQVEIAGVGRVDFLIGDRLIVEIDSDEHHGSRDQRVRDLDRDAVAHSLGYLPLRFDYRQVVSDWDAVASTVFAVIQRGEHLFAKSASGATRRPQG
jgi:very-short-patch-repair endonuclease